MIIIYYYYYYYYMIFIFCGVNCLDRRFLRAGPHRWTKHVLSMLRSRKEQADNTPGQTRRAYPTHMSHRVRAVSRSGPWFHCMRAIVKQAEPST